MTAAIDSCHRYRGILANDAKAAPIREALADTIALEILTGRAKVVDASDGPRLDDLAEELFAYSLTNPAERAVTLFGPRSEATGAFLAEATLAAQAAFFTTTEAGADPKPVTTEVQGSWSIDKESGQLIIDTSEMDNKVHRYNVKYSGSDAAPHFDFVPVSQDDVPLRSTPDECN